MYEKILPIRISATEWPVSYGGGFIVDGGQNYLIRWLYDLEAIFVERSIHLVCEIGGGYGAMAQKIRSRFACKLILIDLPEANILSAYYLSKHFPDARFLLADEVQGKRITLDDVMRHDVIIIPQWYTLADDVKVDLFINTRSMMEMNSDVIKRYFNLIQTHIIEGGFFFNLNRYQKKSVGYPIQFAKYPYDEEWDVVISKPAWRQDDHHFLITRRTSERGNIGEEMQRIAKRGAQFIPTPHLLQRVKDMANRFRRQYL
ncbi:putative sugar O-methyltransferase [Candidatus Kaiserbacteria bacterium]|nr:putative sugar O-methyltransferase [Candidatus Kaiserbacteria bacterium]